MLGTLSLETIRVNREDEYLSLVAQTDQVIADSVHKPVECRSPLSCVGFKVHVNNEETGSNNEGTIQDQNHMSLYQHKIKMFQLTTKVERKNRKENVKL